MAGKLRGDNIKTWRVGPVEAKEIGVLIMSQTETLANKQMYAYEFYGSIGLKVSKNDS